ncbi:hypothetical protein EJ04DRAFT_524039 [Polyplosphaeria fusca]|uniref:Uncharacterized protein n=1 Tax=Polyplosphaeria fusca TaxID=682080 RepID=A0A9P4QZP8_9PLEO|nr:hypothetical protein EJ04DRAFT_524039 [Polyplosphaeria fusca]
MSPFSSISECDDSRRSISKEAGHSRVLAHLTSDENSGHSPTDTSRALVGSLGDTNENPIVLDDLTAGDSRFNPIEIPDDPITHLHPPPTARAAIEGSFYRQRPAPPPIDASYEPATKAPPY